MHVRRQFEHEQLADGEGWYPNERQCAPVGGERRRHIEVNMSSTAGNEKLIAVSGATGRQGGAVVRALQAAGEFKVRALSRKPGKHRDLADEGVEADLNRPETLNAAFEGAHGIFLATNFWQEGT